MSYIEYTDTITMHKQLYINVNEKKEKKCERKMHCGLKRCNLLIENVA